MIKADMSDEKSMRFHRYIKNGLKLVNKFVQVPQGWLNDPSIDADSQACVLRRILVEYVRNEDDRDPRKDMITNLFRFVILLFHNDPFYRERIGWVIWRLHDEIERGSFGYERLLCVDQAGQTVTNICGYDPSDWFGAPAGRGRESPELRDFYCPDTAEMELREAAWAAKVQETYRQMVEAGLIKPESGTTTKDK